MQPLMRMSGSAFRSLVLSVGMLIAWSFFVYQAFVIIVLSREIPVHIFSESVIDRFVPPGGPLIVRISLFREKDCREDVIQSVKDSRGIEFNLPVLRLPDDLPLGARTIKRNIMLPKTMAPGEATLSLSPRFICYWSNYLWPLSNQTHKLSFSIAPDKEAVN